MIVYVIKHYWEFEPNYSILGIFASYEAALAAAKEEKEVYPNDDYVVEGWTVDGSTQ